MRPNSESSLTMRLQQTSSLWVTWAALVSITSLSQPAWVHGDPTTLSNHSASVEGSTLSRIETQNNQTSSLHSSNSNSNSEANSSDNSQTNGPNANFIIRATQSLPVDFEIEAQLETREPTQPEVANYDHYRRRPRWVWPSREHQLINYQSQASASLSSSSNLNQQFEQTSGPSSSSSLSSNSNSNSNSNAGLSLRFAVEPPSWLEFSNSTGARVQCKPALGAPEQPVSVSWRRVRAQIQAHESATMTQPEADEPLAVDAQSGALLSVRNDGSLAFAPFAAAQFDPQWHSATFRCCLRSPGEGAELCSRPMRAKAVVDSPIELEVFDQLGSQGHSTLLKCQFATHLATLLEPLGWLMDDKLVALASAHRTKPKQRLASNQGAQRLKLAQWGSLHISNLSKADAGHYRCRMRHKLTGSVHTSKLAAKLIISDDQQQQQHKFRWLSPNPSLAFAQEQQEQVVVCLQYQASPQMVSKFTWFKLDTQTSTKLPLDEAIRQRDECLIISRAQPRHSGVYICEGPAGHGPIQVKLMVTQLEAPHVHLVAAPISQQQQQQLQIFKTGGFGGDTSVELGGSVQLNCSLSSSSQMSRLVGYDTLVWYKYGHPFAVTSLNGGPQRLLNQSLDQSLAVSKYKLLQEQPTVISIDNFEQLDEAIYQCQVHSSQLQPNLTVTGKASHEAMDSWLLDVGLIASNQLDHFEVAMLRQLQERELFRSASSALSLELQTSKPLLVQKFASSQSLRQGQQAAILCTFTGLPTPRVSWYLDGHLIANDHDNLDRNNHLEIDATSQSMDEIATSSIWPIIQDSDKFQIRQSSNQTSVTSQLNISRLKTSDSGVYKCVATSKLGQAEHSGRLLVPGAKLELRNYAPTNRSLVAGRRAILQCPLTGYPLGRVEWFFNGQRLPSNHRQRVEPIKMDLGGQLELTNVDKLADSGSYSCQASLASHSNSSLTIIDTDDATAAAASAGSDTTAEAFVKVTVRVAPKIDAQSLPELVRAVEGTRTKLVCSIVEGEHPVEIKWLKRTHDRRHQFKLGQTLMLGYELMQNKPDEGAQDSITIVNLEDSCLLTFRQVAPNDAAEYACFARNEVIHSLRLTRLVVDVAPSWLVEPVADIGALVGTRLQLDCAGEGQPRPQATWRRQQIAKQPIDLTMMGDVSAPKLGDFSDLSNSRHKLYSNGTLVLEQVEPSDAGNYMCELTNGVGVGLSKLVNLRVNVAPYFKPQPQTQLGQLASKADIKCLVQGDQPMIVGWRKDGEEVNLRPPTQRNRVSVVDRKLSSHLFESSLSIEHMQRNDSGQYVCIASNEFGTEETRIHLIVQEPPEAPELLRPIRASSRQATLSFRAPYSGNSLVRKYSVVYKPFEADNNGSLTGASQWHQTQLEAPAPQLGANTAGEDSVGLVNLNLCCLSPFTRYLVAVKALNDVGFGELSKPVEFTTDEETIGGPPLDVSVEPTGAHSLKVRWRPPAKHLQNGLIRGYYIGYRAGVSGVASASQQQPLSSPFQINSGQVVKLYEPSMAAQDSSEQYQYKNVQLDMNLLQIQSQNSLMASKMPNQTAQFSHNQLYTSYLTNLRRKTGYSVIVQAYNKVGAGPRSDQILVSTLDAAPPMSPWLKFVSASYNSAQFFWSSRRFAGLDSHNNGQLIAQATSSSSMAENVINTDMILAPDSANFLLEGFDDDPMAFYTINFRLESPTGSGQSPDASVGAPGNSATSSSQQDDWQQRRILKSTSRQQTPYVLTNLRCGSRHVAFMSATNSLGQSEPGNTVKFNTLGGSPVAPKSSRDFVLINPSYLVLVLSSWQNSGCIISSFVIRYKLASQTTNKWVILEHQVHPTVQTTTVAGSAAFSTRVTPEDSDQQSLQATSFMNGISINSSSLSSSLPLQLKAPIADFVIRNLLTNSLYRLVVEANSEAGTTTAEYEVDTGNMTSSTLHVNTNGLVANHDDAMASLTTANQLDPSEGLNFMSEGDFAMTNGRHRVYQATRQAMNSLWSVTGVLVIFALLVVSIMLAVGLRRVSLGISHKHQQRHAGTGSGSSLSTLMSNVIFCCSARSSGASNHSSDHSQTSSGTCYQIGTGEHGNQNGLNQSLGPLDHGYCSFSGSLRGVANVARNSASLVHSNTSVQYDNGKLHELGSMGSMYRNNGICSNSAKQNIYNPNPNGLVSSTSLSAIAASELMGADNHLASNHRELCNNSRTMCRSSTSRPPNQLRHHYAATLGKNNGQHPQVCNTFKPIKFAVSNNLPEKCVSPLYGRLQAGPEATTGGAPSNYGNMSLVSHGHRTIDTIGCISEAATSGYATNSNGLSTILDGGFATSNTSEMDPQQYNPMLLDQAGHQMMPANGVTNDMYAHMSGAPEMGSCVSSQDNGSLRAIGVSGFYGKHQVSDNLQQQLQNLALVEQLGSAEAYGMIFGQPDMQTSYDDSCLGANETNQYQRQA